MNKGVGVEAALGLSEILREIREFHMESAGNFGALQNEINELNSRGLNTWVDTAELRTVENENCKISLTKVLLHSLHLQKQLEAKYKDFEGRDWRKN